MNIKKTMMSLAVALGALTMGAQEAQETVVYDFQPHWFIQGQIGGQETLGEGSFGKLLAPNAQIAVGRQFSPVWGLRLGIGGWMSKGTESFIPTEDNAGTAAFIDTYGPDGRKYWKFYYLAPAVDVLFDVTNAVWGYNPERLVDFNLLAGIGANVAWHNNEAIAYNAAMKRVNSNLPGLQHCWDGTKAWLLGRLGAALDFRCTDNLKVGLELNANFLNDQYNSKHAANCDWYFNALLGVKYAFGKTYEKRIVTNEPIYVEVPVEVIKEVIKEVEVMPVVEEGPFQRDVFFAINSSVITIEEMQKVRDVAEYMRANPDAKCSVTGYADKNTGTLAINLRLAKQRAAAVAKALTQSYGIPESRLIVSSMQNEDYQPFPNDTDQYVLNRVAICIAE